jgi:hypothetical protein
MVAARAPQQKSAPKMKPGAGGIKANASGEANLRQGYGKGKTPAKRPGMSGDKPRGKSSPFPKK